MRKCCLLLAIPAVVRAQDAGAWHDAYPKWNETGWILIPAILLTVTILAAYDHSVGLRKRS